MAKKIIDTKEKVEKVSTLVEMREAIAKAKKEIFELQLDKAQGKMKNVKSLFLKRKEVARLLTKLREMQIYAKNV